MPGIRLPLGDFMRSAAASFPTATLGVPNEKEPRPSSWLSFESEIRTDLLRRKPEQLLDLGLRKNAVAVLVELVELLSGSFLVRLVGKIFIPGD